VTLSDILPTGFGLGDVLIGSSTATRALKPISER